MEEDRVVRLLEEIRDLQHQQVEAYGRALKNQEEALGRQRQAMGRAKVPFFILGAIVIILLVIVVELLRFVVSHYS